jgi:integrase
MEERCRTFVDTARARGNDWLFTILLQFFQSQKERVERKEIAATTLRNYVKTIKLFLEMSDIIIPWKKITRGLPRGRRFADDRAPTIEEIRQIVDYPDRRIKPIIYTMLSSGIRLGAWDYLKWGDITPIFSEEGKTIIAARMVVYRGTEEEYFTFITPEAYNEDKKWMDYRAASGEKIDDHSPLMRNLWEVTKRGPTGEAAVPRMLKACGVKTLLERALWAQHVRASKTGPGRRRHEFQGAHGFRKYFKTHAEQAMKPINVEILMSHSTGISDSYYRPQERDLLEDYLKAVPLLTVNAKSEAGSKKQLEELKQRGMDGTIKDYTIDDLIEIIILLKQEVQQLKKNSSLGNI